MMEIKPWTEVVRLHPDVESEETAVATYAIDLGALVAGDPNVPPTYRDAYSFFRATHLTSDMRMLVEEVYDRLSGKEGNRVLQRRSPFGGVKHWQLYTMRSKTEKRWRKPSLRQGIYPMLRAQELQFSMAKNSTPFQAERLMAKGFAQFGVSCLAIGSL